MRNTRHIRTGLFFSLLTIIIFSLLPQSMLAAPAASQHTAAVSVAPRVTQAIDESQVVTLGRNTRPEANRANDRGALLWFLYQRGQRLAGIRRLQHVTGHVLSPFSDV